MKLVEVTVKDAKVSVEGTEFTSRLSTKMGWELTLEQGLVMARKGEIARIIPVGNIAYMIPDPDAPKRGVAKAG